MNFELTSKGSHILPIEALIGEIDKFFESDSVGQGSLADFWLWAKDRLGVQCSNLVRQYKHSIRPVEPQDIGVRNLQEWLRRQLDVAEELCGTLETLT